MIDYSKFPQQPTKKRNSRFLLFLILLIIISSYIIFKAFYPNFSKRSSKTVSPLAKGLVEGVSFFNPDESSKKLDEVVQKALEGTKGEYAVAIKNLKTGEKYYFNEHKVFESASLYKLFVMATVFQQIQEGSIKNEDILTQKIPILNAKFRISSESAELKEGSISTPVKNALNRMITVSDNYSALLLAEKVRLSQVKLFLEKNSFTESHVGTRGESPSTTAYDIMLFFEKLYREELADKQQTAQMFSLLKNQQLNSKIPRNLPKNVIVSHKTGELGRLSHDSGIVYTPVGDYIIVVLTETSNPEIANSKIADISKSVYEYFTR